MLEFNIADRVGTIVIRRPEAGNAFTGAMARRLGEYMRQAAEVADIVELTGEGADFTIGRDRKEPKQGTPFDAFQAISETNTAIAAFPGILISKVRGRAMGFGVGLVLRSDLAFAADDARFGLDEVAHGIPPMFIMEAMAGRIAPKRALDAVLSGREFGAAEALDMGVVSQLVPASNLDATVAAFIQALHGKDRRVVRACKQYLRAVGEMPADARSAYALVEQTKFAQSKD
jgi:enoyl-CoA hydratase/carnithine racemase